MPSRPIRRSTTRRRVGRRARLALPSSRMRRSLMFNPQPVFTETFTKSIIAPNTGDVMTFRIDEIPQISDYKTLYSKYKILKATVTLLPNYDGQDQNSAQYNIGVANAYASGMGRIVYAINDTAGSLPPTSEADVLKDNGCKIRPFSSRQLVKMGCRPTPVFEDANGTLASQTRKWLTFDQNPTPSEPKHFGISYWYSQPFLGATPTAVNSLNVYVKLTFQLADPR